MKGIGIFPPGEFAGGLSKLHPIQAVPATVLDNVTSLTSFQDFMFPLGNLHLSVQRGIALEMTTTWEQKRSQQRMATPRRASEMSSWDPTTILLSLLESLISISLLLLKVTATCNFPFPFLFFIFIFSLTLTVCISSYSSESIQMRN